MCAGCVQSALFQPSRDQYPPWRHRLSSTHTPSSATEGRLILALYALEIGGIGIGLGLHKYSDRLSALSLRQATLLFGSLAVVVAAAAVVFTCYRDFKRSGSRTFEIGLAMNVIVVAI